MKQVLVGGIYSLLNITTTEYNVVTGAISWVAGGIKFQVAQAISTPGKLKNLRVELNDTPGGGSKTYTFTLHRAVGTGGWANTALTCTVGSGDTQASDMVNEVAVAAGDVVVIECDPTDSPTSRYVKWSMVFEGDNANESLLLAVTDTNDGAIRYFRPMGALGSTGDELFARSVCPTSGTIKNLFVQLHIDPGTAPDAYRFTLRLNGATVGESSIVTITADNRTGNDTGHNLAVVAGDVLTMMIEPLNVPSAEPWIAVGMTFIADTDGESIILGGSGNGPNTTTTRYNHLLSYSGDAWETDEFRTYQLAQVCTLKKLYMLLNDSPGSNNKYTFTVRRNGTSPAGGLVVEIADAATTGNDTGNAVALINDDELDLMSVPTSTPTLRQAYWGLVSFIEPPSGIENKSANMAVALITEGLI